MVAPSNDENRRGGDRSPVTLKVEYKRLNTFFAEYTKNISKGGTFIKTQSPLPLGTEFVFELSLVSLDTAIKLRGEVVWTRDAETAPDPDLAGMGVRFKFKDEAERRAVAELVESLMSEALGEHLSKKLMNRTTTS